MDITSYSNELVKFDQFKVEFNDNANLNLCVSKVEYKFDASLDGEILVIKFNVLQDSDIFSTLRSIAGEDKAIKIKITLADGEGNELMVVTEDYFSLIKYGSLLDYQSADFLAVNAIFMREEDF